MPPKPFNAKKAKLYNSRTIKTQINDQSIINKERLSIPEFLNSRSFEIKAFELSQLNSKYASSTRVFQSLPRVMRRRTASHNVKRIPRRLRSRAIREMNSSASPAAIKKKVKSTGRQLYHIRMAKKLLRLSTKLQRLRHLPQSDCYNRSVNLRGKFALLNDQIKELQKTKGYVKLNNVLGSYDNTGVNQLASKPRGSIKYYKRQSEFVWLPTHIWHAKRFHMMKQHGFQVPLTPTQKCFKLMNRQSKMGTIIFDTSYYNTAVIKIADESEFKKFLLDITKFKSKIPDSIIKGRKSYNGWLRLNDKNVGHCLIYANVKTKSLLVRVHPAIYEDVFEALKERLHPLDHSIDDCRYSIGSLSLIGPNAIRSISKVLHFADVSEKIKDNWRDIIQINDSGIIPVGTTFSFNVRDPRFWKKPAFVPITMNYKDSLLMSKNQGYELKSVNEITNDLVIRLQSTSSVDENTIDKLLSVEGRSESYKNQLSVKVINREFSKILSSANSLQDSILSTSNIPILITKTSSFQWSLICPWYWVVPIWNYSVKLSDIKAGGIKQINQVMFEHGQASFPQDYPWLRDGWEYNESVGKINQQKYEILPKKYKKYHLEDYEDQEYNSPFKCDWKSLRSTILIKKWKGLSREELMAEKPGFAQYDPETLNREVKSLHDLKQFVKTLDAIPNQIPIDVFDKENEEHQRFVKGEYEIKSLREVESYVLPMMQVWVRVAEGGRIEDGARVYQDNVDKDIADVVGYITTGNFNLNSGYYEGIGMIVAQNLEGKEFYTRNIGATKYNKVEFRII